MKFKNSVFCQWSITSGDDCGFLCHLQLLLCWLNFLIFQYWIEQAKTPFIFQKVESMGVYELETTKPGFKMQSLIQIMHTH